MADQLLNLDGCDARRTSDGKVAVLDVISHVTGKSRTYASNAYKRLVAEERVPECEMRALPLRVHSLTSPIWGCQRVQRGGATQTYPTPVATVGEMVEVIWQLPGTAEFRRSCARLVVRYLGGDESLIEEIHLIRSAQEELADVDPTHPARLFGEAVEAEAPPVTGEGLRRLTLENDALELQNLTAARRALLDVGVELDDAQQWAFRDRVSDMLNGRSSSPRAERTMHASQFLSETKRMPANEVRRLSSQFGKIAARRKRVADGLEPGAPLPTAMKSVGGHPTPVAIYRVPEELEILEAAHTELLRADAAAGSRPVGGMWSGRTLVPRGRVTSVRGTP